MLSLPIPDRRSTVTYEEITHDGQSIGDLVENLTGGRVPRWHRAHLDPDLVESARPRRAGWRPIFGQTGPAQGHLRKFGVGPGDLFLFFGLFRPTRLEERKLTWAKDELPRHLIWGWLQVSEVLSPHLLERQAVAWALDHPHFQRGEERNNTVYVARSRLELGLRLGAEIAGSGVFSTFRRELQLTANGAARSTNWILPAFFLPQPGRTALSFHSDPGRWEHQDGQALLSAAARGQEFVLDCDEYPEAVHWIVRLLTLPR